MKKTNATLVCIALVAMAVFSWISVIKGGIDDASAYDKYIQQAEQYEQKGIYIDALTCYQNAQKIRPNEYGLAIRIASSYEKLGDKNGFLKACDAAAALDKNTSEPYVMKAEYYINNNRYTDAIKVVQNVPRKLEQDSEITRIQEELNYKYVVKYVSFEEIYDWNESGKTSYASAQKDGLWGMVDKEGAQKLRFRFDYLGAYDEATGVIPCCENSIYYYMDINGNKKLVGDLDYQYLGSFGCGYAPAQRDGVFGYINAEFEESNFEYDYAGAFANNVAAVERNGKWALVNDKLKLITDFVYDDILMDDYGFCSKYETIVARVGSEFVFLNTDGKQSSLQGFEQAAIPASKDGLIAIMNRGKWGFADKNGNIVIQEQYEEAKSFSLGLAPIKQGDLWGYVNTDGRLVTEMEFYEANPFSKDGAATVKSKFSWSIITLCKYDT